MDTQNLMPLLEQLDDNIDDAEEVLGPLISQSLPKLSKNLPIMDKAKIHVMTAYAFESLIFCKLSSISSISMRFSNLSIQHICVSRALT